MRLICLGSGSSGNCYLLENDAECLVVEAGIPFKAVKKALNFNISKIVGVVVSHSHGDHAGRVHEYEAAGIPVFKPYEKWTNIDLKKRSLFMVQAFDLTDKRGRFVHSNSDGSECPCYGFYISHPEMGSLVYATDCEFIKWQFSELNHILVEANYSTDLIDPGAVNRNHVLTGHMSLQTTLDFLRVNNNPGLRNVILCHLSSNNADPVAFREQARKVVDCPVYVTEKGLTVNVGLMPF